MEKPRWSILYLGIIFFILKGVNGVTEITSCSVTAGADRESLTFNVTYVGDDHRRTYIHFYDPLRAITAIEDPCLTSSSSPDLIIYSCSTNSSSTYSYVRLYYNPNSFTNTNITVRKFNFPIESQSYSNVILVQAFNSSSHPGSFVYCSNFSSLPGFSLLGNLYISIFLSKFGSEYAK